jgi:hypothetical protein
MGNLRRIFTSANRRFLVTGDGKPFFWLGDTAWELFHRPSLADAEMYLENRRQKGFNVTQAVVLAEVDGVRTPNANGDLPFHDLDPARPNEAYFRHVDQVVALAAQKGIYVAMLPTWGDKWNMKWGAGPLLFTVENARAYGQFLGERYRDAENIIWVMGGDRPEVSDETDYAPVVREMARGVQAGVAGHTFMTYHPAGGRGSSMAFHDDDWLDLHMWQSGHVHRDAHNWALIAADYARVPVKPVLDAEPAYEDHPIDPFTRKWGDDHGRFDDDDVRKAAYRAVFAGACGHTYGHHSIWQMYEEGRAPINFPWPDWRTALDRPGAGQLIHLKHLMLSRPYFDRVPDQSLIASDAGEGVSHVRATRAADGSYALIYIPMPGQTVQINTTALTGDKLTAWWYNPRTGEATRAREYQRGRVVTVISPHDGPDWVLALDDVSKGYGAPAQS